MRRAYELYRPHHRQSWDQTAVLFAVRGLDGGLADYWDVQGKGQMHIKEDGSDLWRESADKGQYLHLVKKMPPEKIAAVIEELMLQPPQTKQ